MRKLVQITPYYWPHMGGVETHVKALNKELYKDFDITVLTTQHATDVPLTDLDEGIKILRLPKSYFNQKLKTWAWLWQNRQVIFEADVIHVHDIVWWLYPFIPFCRFKIYATFHGWEGIFPIPWRNKILRRCNSWIVKKTLHVGAWIETFYGDKPDAIIYGGVDSIIKTSKISTSHEDIQCVFVGRLEAVNDITLYIELFCLLQKHYPGASIAWVGEGSYRLVCQKYGQVTGMISHTRDHIFDADVVFASSYLSILEAQHLGKVVVGLYSNRLKKAYLESFPGFKYMIVAPNPILAVEQIVNLLKNNSELEVLSDKAKIFANSQTWKKIAQTYKKVWTL